MGYYGKKYTMVPHRGVWDEKTKRGYNHTNLPDSVAKRLLDAGKYEDRIMLIDDFELLKRPDYSKFLAFRVDAEEKKLTLSNAIKEEKARVEAVREAEELIRKEEREKFKESGPIKENGDVQKSNKV